MKAEIKSLLLFGAMAFALIMKCSSAGPGNSSEVLNGTLINSDNGQPACNASVVMRPRNYLPKLPLTERQASDNSFICSTFTDVRGEYKFTMMKTIPEGIYCIEGRDSQNNCVLIDSFMIKPDSNYLPLTDTLKSPATIQGTLALTDDSTKAYVRVYGLDVYKKVNSNGDFSLGDLPEGKLRLYILIARGDDTYDTEEVAVATSAGGTKNIDSLFSAPLSVAYVGNGNTDGTVPSDGKRYYTGDTAKILGNAGADSLRRMGFTFVGWNTEANGSGIAFTERTQYRIKAENLTLYAQWKPDGMVLIAAKGITFPMGDTFSYDDRQPVHPVKFSVDFWLDTTEVTQGNYSAVMTAAYSTSFVSPAWNSLYGVGVNYPAYFVNWYDAALYCNARTKASKSSDTVYTYTSIIGTPGSGCVLEGLGIDPNAGGFRLPTEAQWEYAYRAGTPTDGNSDSAIINEYKGTLSSYGSTTHPVALEQKNVFSLYDMSWNVWEWCNDWYGTYLGGLQSDPSGPTSGLQRVIRGGSWASFAGTNSLVSRGEHLPDVISHDCGFRTCFPTK
jgi:uncharacterized repeat protein (TIGR02543 family)